MGPRGNARKTHFHLGITSVSHGFSDRFNGLLAAVSAPAFPARCGNAVFHPCGTALVAERFPDRRAMAISLLLPVIWFRYRWIRGGQPPAGPKSLLTGAPNLVVEVLSPRTAERVTI